MTETSLCRLCICAYTECKSLFDELGQGNEVYEITVKYFDPMFLTSQQYPQLSMVICLKCWDHINDFHCFQQSVLNAQTNFEQEYKHLVTNIKQEVDYLHTPTEYIINTLTARDHKVFNNEDEKNEIFLPDFRINEIKDDNPIISKTATGKKPGRQSKKQEDKHNDDSPSKRTCKPRNTNNSKIASVKTPVKRKAKTETSNNKKESEVANHANHKMNYSDQDSNVSSNEGDDDEIEIDNVTNEPIQDLYRGEDENNDDFVYENIHIKCELEIDEDDQTGLKDEDGQIKPCNSSDMTKNDEVLKIKPKQKRGRKPKNDKQTAKIKEILDSEENSTKVKKAKQDHDDENKNEKGNSKFNLEKARESDAFIRQWKSELECDICEETASNFDQLRIHFKEKHNTKCYIKCCERKFFRRYLLVNHIQLHINPETHKCEICGKVSANKNNLKLHKRLMHEENEKLECYICHKLFTQKITLQQHLLTHVTGDKNFVCQECGKAYVLEVKLKSHIKTVHNVDRVCDQCGKTIHGIQSFKKHLMQHAGIPKPKFPCDECGVELDSRVGVKRHKAAYHHDGSTVYVCSICGKVAANEYALLKHKRYVHEVERKHKCTYCEKAFKWPKDLVEHIATHTGQDLYQCPHCPQTFKIRANMHHHRKKAHPVEFEEGRKNRLPLPKLDITHVTNQVVL
ncbi:uncharacterized protein ACRADG_008758 [Cochliomyia hominivorax]